MKAVFQLIFLIMSKTGLTVSYLHLDNLLCDKLDEVRKNSFQFYLWIRNYLQNDEWKPSILSTSASRFLVAGCLAAIFFKNTCLDDVQLQG